jgi:O-methyltransferase involved in polyketide biosynthesis
MVDRSPGLLTAFEGIARTALIPLAARARAREYPDLDFADPIAEAVATQLNDRGFGPDFDRLAADRAMQRGCILRAAWFDRMVGDFLDRHPVAGVVNLGAGLDTAFHRLRGRCPDWQGHWWDVDRPGMVALHRRLVPAARRHHLIARDIGDPGWWDEIPDAPALCFTASGLLMYLDPAAVAGLFADAAELARVSGSPLRLVFDYLSPAAVTFGGFNPSIAMTLGSWTSPFRWSLADPGDILALVPGGRLVAAVDLSAGMGGMAALTAAAHRLWYGGSALHGCAVIEIAGNG